MTRQGRRIRVLIGGLALTGIAACLGFGPAAPVPPLAAAAEPPQGMTQSELQLVLSRLEAIERQQGWLWLAVAGSGAVGSSIGAGLIARRRPAHPHAFPPSTARSLEE